MVSSVLYPLIYLLVSYSVDYLDMAQVSAQASDLTASHSPLAGYGLPHVK